MLGMLGANPAEMEALHARFATSSMEVADLTTRVEAAVQSTSWTGPAADRFRAQWEGEFRAALGGLRAALEDNAAFVRARLDAIHQATA